MIKRNHPSCFAQANVILPPRDNTIQIILYGEWLLCIKYKYGEYSEANNRAKFCRNRREKRDRCRIVGNYVTLRAAWEHAYLPGKIVNASFLASSLVEPPNVTFSNMQMRKTRVARCDPSTRSRAVRLFVSNGARVSTTSWFNTISKVTKRTWSIGAVVPRLVWYFIVFTASLLSSLPPPIILFSLIHLFSRPRYHCVTVKSFRHGAKVLLSI